MASKTLYFFAVLYSLAALAFFMDNEVIEAGKGALFALALFVTGKALS